MLESKRDPILEPPRPQKKYDVIFDNDKCDGCKLCIEFCPKELLGTDADKFNSRMLHYVVFISDQACVGCRMCERLCPTASIFIKETEMGEEDDHE
ncbi:MAG: indolepyruvate ferredoxin oxidoreductase subunit alpha [Promethearchaeota archaeon]|jgi:2-oxoglutarate ferredoxin oxidoreductase subunit delta